VADSPPPSKDAAPEDPGGLGKLADGVRASMWWVAGAFGAVALLLLPGLGVADVGSLESPRRWIAIGIAAIGIAAAAAMAQAIVRFARVGSVSLEQLVRDGGPRRAQIVAYLDRNDTLFAGEAESVVGLHRVYWQALEALADARAQAREGIEGAASRASSAAVRVLVLEQAIDNVERVARLEELRLGFEDRRRALVVLTAVVFAAMLGFAFAAHPPDPAPSDFSGARLVQLDLSGTSLREADFDGATLDHVSLDGADVEGADFDGANWDHATCPDGANSEDAGDTCEDDLVIPAQLTPSERGTPGGGDGAG